MINYYCNKCRRQYDSSVLSLENTPDGIKCPSYGCKGKLMGFEAICYPLFKALTDACFTVDNIYIVSSPYENRIECLGFGIETNEHAHIPLFNKLVNYYTADGNVTLHLFSTDGVTYFMYDVGGSDMIESYESVIKFSRKLIEWLDAEDEHFSF